MTEYFVGRQDELDTFKRCLTSQTQNGIYYFGPGGIGKSVLLKKITAECQAKPDLQASFIDFFSTKNRSIEGLQNTIIEQLDDPPAFQEIFDTRRKLEEVRTSPEFGYRKELISSLQKHIEVIFPRCCNEAAKDRQRVLVFDSFEYVQTCDIGRWFLFDFLPNVKSDGKYGIIVVLAGRPEPTPARTPENIITSLLGGLKKEEVKTYLDLLGLKWGEDFEALIEGSQGNPLLIELLRWRGCRELMTDQQRLREIIRRPEVMAREIFDEIAGPTPRNRVLWAMALFKRRFDFEMLRYLVENIHWLRNVEEADLRNQLQELPFVKSDIDVASHLLHDAVVEPITIVFNGVSGYSELKDDLFQKIIHAYYPERIQEAQSEHERMYLQTEQLGYILDQNIDDGIAEYRIYLEEIRQQNKYDFEELLWGEVFAHIKEEPQKYISITLERAQWLYENGLYRELETLSLFIFNIQDIDFEDKLKGSQYHGFALMRQGKLKEAEKQFQESLKIAQQLQSDIPIIETENNFGQLAALAGKYDKAAKHYWKSIKRHSDSTPPEELATSYSARGFFLAMQGQYHRGLIHCLFALKLFEKYPHTLRQIYAFRNIGMVYRFLGDYTNARKYLVKGRQLAEQGKFIELETDVLRELAHTAYLRGRRAREESRNFNLDCNNQAQALSALATALEKARTIAHRIQISRSLIQLAYVFEEITRLEWAKNDSPVFPSLLVEELLEEAHTIPITEDEHWLQHGLEHFPNKTFSNLSLLQRVVRLFEIGSLEAAEASQSHTVIESQAELIRVLIELKAWKEIEMRIERIRQSRSEVYDDQKLSALITLLQADIAFDHGDLNGALPRYSHAIPIIVGIRGTITDISNTRINELLKRIKLIPDKQIALEWCRILQETWANIRLEESFLSIIERIQMLSHELLEEISTEIF